MGKRNKNRKVLQKRLEQKQRTKNNQKVRELNSYKNIEEYKKSLTPLISEANNRIELIQVSKFDSFAVRRLEEETGRDYFDVDDIKSMGDLLSEATRLRVFLADKSSTLEGAKLDTSQLAAQQYKGLFGNQYNTEEYNYKRFNDKIIDEDIAKRAFKTYRKLEEDRKALITQYGSENLISVLYDCEVKGKDSYNYGADLLETNYDQQEFYWNQDINDFKFTSAMIGNIVENIEKELNF